MRTLDQNDLGLDSALKTVKAHIDASGDPNLDQAWRRIELQVGRSAPGRLAARPARSMSVRRVAADTPRRRIPDPILNNPEEVFRAEVMQSLIDACSITAPRSALPPTNG